MISRLRRTLTFRRKRQQPLDPVTCINGAAGDSSVNKPRDWELDAEAIRNKKNCRFTVKYLGEIEVFEARGVDICESAIAALDKRKKIPRIFRRKTKLCILVVDGTSLKVYNANSSNMIVDQTIEKVSFCAPHKNNERGFAYISRDGVSRRWMCHAFLAVNETGSRLSHAVGVAFEICLENKQSREKAAAAASVSENNNNAPQFTRNSQLRHTTIAERLLDPQSVKATPLNSIANGAVNGKDISKQSPSLSGKTSPTLPLALVPYEKPSARGDAINASISRPRPSPNFNSRQTSLRQIAFGSNGKPDQQSNSPFHREMSLRLLPNTLETGTKLQEFKKFLDNAATKSANHALLEEELLSLEPAPVDSKIQETEISNQAIVTAPPAPSTRANFGSDFDPFSAAPLDKSSLLDWRRKQEQPIHTSTPWSAIAVTASEASSASGQLPIHNNNTNWTTGTMSDMPASIVFTGKMPNPINVTQESGVPLKFAASSAISPPVLSLFNGEDVMFAKQPEINLRPFLGGPPIAAPVESVNYGPQSPLAIPANGKEVTFWSNSGYAAPTQAQPTSPVILPVSAGVASSVKLLPSEKNLRLVNSDPFDTSWADHTVSAHIHQTATTTSTNALS